MSEDANQEVTITLEESINLDNIDALHSLLIGVNPSNTKKVTIDADDLEDIDFIGMQLLVSFIKKMQSLDVKTEWDNIPIPLFQAATDLDFCDSLCL